MRFPPTLEKEKGGRRTNRLHGREKKPQFAVQLLLTVSARFSCFLACRRRRAKGAIESREVRFQASKQKLKMSAVTGKGALLHCEVRLTTGDYVSSTGRTGSTAC